MIEDELFALRQEYKKKMKQAKDEEERRIWDMKQQAVKIILNAVYGFTGQRGSRLYHVPTAETVTAFGRAIISDFLANVVRDFPETGELQVIYGDTDSVFVRLPERLSHEEAIDLAKKLEKFINSKFPEFAKRWGAKVCYHELEFQKLYEAILFTGKKKRYYGKYVWKEGAWEEGFDVKGFEIVRTDTAKITATVMDEVLKTLVTTKNKMEGLKKAKEIIQEYKRKIRAGEVPIEDLVFKSSIDPGKEYKALPPQLRGLKNAVNLKLVETDYAGQVFWLYVKGLKKDSMLSKTKGITVIALPEEKKALFDMFEIDYTRCEERWFGPVERIIETIERAVSQRRL